VARLSGTVPGRQTPISRPAKNAIFFSRRSIHGMQDLPCKEQYFSISFACPCHTKDRVFRTTCSHKNVKLCREYGKQSCGYRPPAPSPSAILWLSPSDCGRRWWPGKGGSSPETSEKLDWSMTGAGAQATPPRATTASNDPPAKPVAFDGWLLQGACAVGQKPSRRPGRDCRGPGATDGCDLTRPCELDSCRAVLPGTLRASANPLPADWSCRAVLPDTLRASANPLPADWSCRAVLPDTLRASANPLPADWSCRAVLPGTLRASANPLPADWSCPAVLPDTRRAGANPLPADWSGNPCRNDDQPNFDKAPLQGLSNFASPPAKPGAFPR
jgi:hypothetical protein